MRHSLRIWRAVVAGLMSLALIADVGQAREPEASRSRINHLATAVAPIGGVQLAFQGSLVFASNVHGFGIYRIVERAPYLEFISYYYCPGGDLSRISVWGDYVLQSVIDSPWREISVFDYDVETSVCNNTDASMGKGGIRVIDISNIYRPRQVGFIDLPGGSHQHTLVPDGNRLYIYSYLPLGDHEQRGIPAPNTNLRIIRFDPHDPRRSRPVSNPDMVPLPGCADITVLEARQLAACTAFAAVYLLDISDPANPEPLGERVAASTPPRPTIYEPEANWFYHAQFTWDGRYLVLADIGEMIYTLNFAAPCTGDDSDTRGTLWFYDITDPARPKQVGRFALPRAKTNTCAPFKTHVLPMKDPRRYVLAAAWEKGGFDVVDFSDPTQPTEIAFWDEAPNQQSVGWYRGRLYTAGPYQWPRGVHVFEVEGFDPADFRSTGPRLNPENQIEPRRLHPALATTNPPLPQTSPSPIRLSSPHVVEGSVATSQKDGSRCNTNRHEALRASLPEEASGRINGRVAFDFPIPDRTWGARFSLEATGGDGDVDFDIAFAVRFHKPFMHFRAMTHYRFETRSKGGESGIIPHDVTRAIVCMHEGSNASFEYVGGAPP